MDFAQVLATEFNMKLEHSSNIIKFLDEGCTVPFIARYRKEWTGSCDDQKVRNFADRLQYLRNLEKRKEEVINSITEQGKMTDELLQEINNALTQTEVEDIYRPFKQKRKTRASEAIRKGLQPLALIILEQKSQTQPKVVAKDYLNEEVLTVEDALQGAKDIIAEMVSDSPELRKILREQYFNRAEIACTLVENENSKVYEGYDGFSERINKIPSHRILAINRGEKEDCLKVKFTVNNENLLFYIYKEFLKLSKEAREDISNYNECNILVKEACDDGFVRLLQPSLENEVRTLLTDKANEQAIKMFDSNLRPLLLQPPLKNKVVLGLDPAYRTGCKIAVVDATGKVLDKCVIYPTPPQNKIAEATLKLTQLIDKYGVDVISIGNGTASKESEIFVADLIKKQTRKVSYMVVNEAGASVYSASKLGMEEFPDYDVTERSAVSIARRLQDPLAELIKIDVKSIGVGQYQHDMPQARLGEVLGWVVEDCVNSVGVDLNTASYSLLSYVSGLNKSIAKNIVEYRVANGEFKTREQLLNVPKLGAKAYEQCAGFLRIINGKNILDNTAVHPESYSACKKLLEHFGLSENDVAHERVNELPTLIEKEGYDKVAAICGVGEPTLVDIVNELLKPGRDIRDELPKPILRSDVMDISDLKEGMVFTGTVRNVIDFGAFVDIGVHQDGLVHISEISKEYIKHPSEVLKVGDVVNVKIIGIDLNKKRISLTIKGCDSIADLKEN